MERGRVELLQPPPYPNPFPSLTTRHHPLQLRSSARCRYNERAASVPAVGTEVLVQRVISGAVQGGLSGWHAGEVTAMLQGASFLTEVRPAPPRPAP